MSRRYLCQYLGCTEPATVVTRAGLRCQHPHPADSPAPVRAHVLALIVERFGGAA